MKDRTATPAATPTDSHSTTEVSLLPSSPAAAAALAGLGEADVNADGVAVLPDSTSSSGVGVCVGAVGCWAAGVVGEVTVGAAVVGSVVTGDAVGTGVVGSEVAGDAVVGSDVVGSGVVGAEVRSTGVVGPTVVGDAVVGSDVIGDFVGAAVVGDVVAGGDATVVPNCTSVRYSWKRD